MKKLSINQDYNHYENIYFPQYIYSFIFKFNKN